MADKIAVQLLVSCLQLPAWYPTFQYTATYIAFCNSAVNPAIYAGFNDNFKRSKNHGIL